MNCGLAAIPEGDPRYFFWSGHGGPEHAANLWGKALRRLWPMVKPALDLQDRYGYPPRPSPHFFRNTFAKEVETGKVSITNSQPCSVTIQLHVVDNLRMQRSRRPWSGQHVGEISPRTMPSSRKVNLEKVQASLDAVCPKCGRMIPPPR